MYTRNFVVAIRTSRIWWPAVLRAISRSRLRIGWSGTGTSRFGSRIGKMRLSLGLLRALLLRVPAHAFEVHHCDVVVLGVAADAAFAGPVVQLAAFVLKLVEAVAVAVVSGVDDAH